MFEKVVVSKPFFHKSSLDFFLQFKFMYYMCPESRLMRRHGEADDSFPLGGSRPGVDNIAKCLRPLMQQSSLRTTGHRFDKAVLLVIFVVHVQFPCGG